MAARTPPRIDDNILATIAMPDYEEKEKDLSGTTAAAEQHCVRRKALCLERRQGAAAAITIQKQSK